MNKLYRNPCKGYIGGVCQGIGEYWDIDPIIARALFLITIPGGSPVLYIGLWIFLKKNTCEL